MTTTDMTNSFCDQLTVIKSSTPGISLHDYLGVSDGDDPRHKEEVWELCSEWAARVKRQRKSSQVVQNEEDGGVADVSEVDKDVLTAAMFEKRMFEEDRAGGATTIEKTVEDDGTWITWRYKGNGWKMTTGGRKPKAIEDDL
ncbi:hypothetical protein IAT38_004914 [Cryptococcus sp. DSM 104549]